MATHVQTIYIRHIYPYLSLLAVFALMTVLLLALAWLASSRSRRGERDDAFIDWDKMTTEGAAIMCQGPGPGCKTDKINDLTADGWVTGRGYMAPGSLSIGGPGQSYGGGTGWNANTAGLLLETQANTEIAVHDHGHRVASMIQYQGDATNTMTLGRDMGWGPTKVRVESDVALNGSIQMERGDPGAMIERKYGNNQGDRYGVGQFPAGTHRVYAAQAFGPATVNLSMAKSDGGFNDVLTVDNNSHVAVNGKLTLKKGDTNWNWLRVEGNHGDNAYLGSDGTNRGIWADGARDFSIYNYGKGGNNNPWGGQWGKGLTVKPGGEVEVSTLQVKGGDLVAQNVKVSGQWSGFPDNATGQSEISNDTAHYKKLMIVGNKSSGENIRKVGIWDRLDVHGNQGVLGDLAVAGKFCLGNTCITEEDLKGVMTRAQTQTQTQTQTQANGRGTMARYVRLMAAARVDCMNIAEVQVFDASGAKVSVGKPVTMSSGYQGDMFPGRNLTDGNNGNFAHTSCSDRGWMMIDLGSEVMVSVVRVFNRTDCCQFRLVGTRVELIDKGRNVIFTSGPLNEAAVQDVGTIGENKQLSDGLKFTIHAGYFNDNVAHFLDAQQTDTGVTTDVGNINLGTNNIIAANGPRHYYSVQWTGMFKARVSGTHTFWISSDDASFVWIGQLATSGYTADNATLRNGGLHGMREVNGAVNMNQGDYYPIRVQFGENGGGHDCQFTFAEPGGSRRSDGRGYFFTS
jgi:hypothetical protein